MSGATRKNSRPTEFYVGGPFIANGWFELLLFRGFVGLHIKIIPFSPRLTPRASGALRLTSLVESGAPRLKSFLKTGMVTPCHTGRSWSGWC
jgi:hypothetical protein